MSASLQGQVDVVGTLVQHGAKVDLKKEVNFMFLAIEKLESECFCLLCSYYV